jgi:DNA-binding NtrC family response regulator
VTGKRILVIDDDQAVRFTLEAILTSAGYEVMLADTGISGMRLYRTAPPDLVITDIIMPDQEGIETIIEIRRKDPGAKIIAISGGGRYANGHFLELAMGLGANAALAKPFDLDELLAVVQRWLPAAANGIEDDRPRAATG